MWEVSTRRYKICTNFDKVSILMPIIVWSSLKPIHCYGSVGVDEKIKFIPIESVGIGEVGSYFL